MTTHWMGACYIPLRDDHGKKSLSTAERDFLLSACGQGRPLRLDGRKPHQGRIDTTVLHLQRQYLYESSHASSPNSSSSSSSTNSAGGMSSTSTATVVWAGATRVHATCTAQMVPPPLPDRPNEGRVNLSVSLSAAARTSFRHGPPATNGGMSSKSGGVEDVEQKRLTNRLLRTLERLLGPTTLDPEALCIVAGHWVWQLDVTVTVLDAAAGNVLDAAVFGTLAAVRHYRKLHVQLADTAGPPTLIPAHTKEPTPLPLHHTPLTVSFGLLRLPASMRHQGNENEEDSLVLLLDPSAREELVLEASENNMESTVLCMAMNAHFETVWMDWAGCPVSLETLQTAHEACRVQVSGLTQSLEDALAKAHAQATALQLQELQRRDNAELLALPPMPHEDNGNVAVLPPAAPPVWKSLHQTTTAANTVVSQEDDRDDSVTAVNAAAAAAALAAEEAHRQDALDYNKGHMTTKVRDNDSNATKQSSTSALLQALLQSVTTTPSKGQTKQSASSATKSVDATSALQSEPMQVDPPEPSPAPVAAPAEAAPTKKTAPTAATMNDDDDEEEETMQLQSEFSTVAALAPAPPPPAAPAPQPPHVNGNDDDDDVDDLAAAVMKKKKKKSKKK